MVQSIGLAVSQSIVTRSEEEMYEDNLNLSIMHREVSWKLYTVTVDNTISSSGIASYFGMDERVVAGDNTDVRLIRTVSGDGGGGYDEGFVEELRGRLWGLLAGKRGCGCGWEGFGRKGTVAVDGIRGVVKRGRGGVYGCVGLMGGCAVEKGKGYYMEIGVGSGGGGVCLGIGVGEDGDDEIGSSAVGRNHKGFKGGLVGAGGCSIGFHSSGSLVEVDGEWKDFGRKWGCRDTVGMLVCINDGQDFAVDGVAEGVFEGADDDLNFSDVTSAPSGPSQKTSDDDEDEDDDKCPRRHTVGAHDVQTHHRARPARRRQCGTTVEVSYFVNGEYCGVVRDPEVNAAVQSGRSVYPAVSIYKQGAEIECRCCPSRWNFFTSASKILDTHLSPFCNVNSGPESKFYDCKSEDRLSSSRVTP